MIGIIGGTGLYRLEELSEMERLTVSTPFGPPSADIVLGQYGSTRVAFLPRHGQNHQLLPSEINYRANLWALKSVGVRRVIGVSAVGSLSADISPGDLAMPSQYLDFTKGQRAHTFFGNGIVAHISTAVPSCETLASKVRQVVSSFGFPLHADRTYACVEGPRLGNKAESAFMRSGGAHLVGMTNVPEVYLAREAQLCYCTIAVVTDYDCWMEDPAAHASVDQVLTLYRQNLDRVRQILMQLLQEEETNGECECRHALDHAVLTHENTLSEDQSRYLAFLKT